MAKLPTADEKARMALEAFRSINGRPGDVVTRRHFTAVALEKRWRSDEVAEGIKEGYDRGWFEDGPNGSVRLTKAGFSEL